MEATSISQPLQRGKLILAWGKSLLCEVATANEASAFMKVLRTAYDLGASDISHLSVFDTAMNEIGYVSYNGRVWSGRPGIGQTNELVFDPCASSAR